MLSLSSRLDETGGHELKHQYLLEKINISWSRWLLRPVGHQTCQLTAWKPGVLSQESSPKRSQPGFRPQSGVLSQESSARRLQPGFPSQESSARSPQPDSEKISVRNPQPRIHSQDSSANLFGVRAGVISFCLLQLDYVWMPGSYFL